MRWVGMRWVGMRWVGMRWTGMRWTGMRWGVGDGVSPTHSKKGGLEKRFKVVLFIHSLRGVRPRRTSGRAMWSSPSLGSNNQRLTIFRKMKKKTSTEKK
jgi:hypothetical protein